MNYYLQAFDKLENLLKILSRAYESRRNNRYQIIFPEECKLEEIERACELIFVNNSLDFFIRRSLFILKNLKCDLLNDEELEILRTIFRGFIEVLARFYYLKKDKYGFSLRYLWELVYNYLYLDEDREDRQRLIYFYNLLQHINIKPDLPDMNKLEKIFLKYYENPFIEDDDIKEFKKLNKKYSYPSVYSLLKKYCDDSFKKNELYWFYGFFSKQIHADFIFEGWGNSSVSIRHQILGFLIFIIKEFIFMINDYFSKNEIKEINEVKEGLLKIEIYFRKEWENFSFTWS